MSQYNNQPFSTKDRDNDNWRGNCAVEKRSGWWHKWCTQANLNGQYYGSKQKNNKSAIVWKTWRHNMNSMKRIEMKIKLN